MTPRLAHDTVIVDLDTLRKVLADRHGVCHRFEVASVSKNRVKVGYSNPDEYGNADWTYAIFPTYQTQICGVKARIVVLEIVRMVNDPDDFNWQSFDFLKEACKKEVYGQ